MLFERSTTLFTAIHAVCSTFGYPLEDGDGYGDADLNPAVDACDGVVPKFLLLFYRHAARNKRFAQAFNRYLPPSEWQAVENHLTFMANDETNERWGILLGTEYYEQPPVEKTVSGGAWQYVSDNLPFFLTFTLHLNAVKGGFDFCGHTVAHQLTDDSLDGWSFGGSASGLIAYSRRRQAVCFGQSELCAGAKTAKDLRSIERDLEVSLQKSR
jgi:hypothetical protein